MVAWSDMPREMRQEIVKKLDLRTRFRLRHVSKTNQEMVDSAPLNLPRIVLKFENDHQAKLEFYLGINRKISVYFEKSKEGEVKVTISGESINEPIQKLVECENAALLAITAFKNVAIHPNTLFEGLEFSHNDNMTTTTRFKIFQLIKYTGIRTKTLCISGTTNLYMILPHCNNRDLLELQTIDVEDEGSEFPLAMVAHTRKLKIDVENTLAVKFDLNYVYTPVANRSLANIKISCRMMDFSNWEKKQKAPDDITFYGSADGDYAYHHVTSCGDLACNASRPFTIKNPGACEMRWTCAKHADPFEYWYYQQVIKPYGPEVGGLDVGSMFQALESVGFAMPDFPVPFSYNEVLFPVANDVDTVFVMTAVAMQLGEKWEQRVLNGEEPEIPKRWDDEEEGEPEQAPSFFSQIYQALEQFLALDEQ